MRAGSNGVASISSDRRLERGGRGVHLFSTCCVFASPNSTRVIAMTLFATERSRVTPPPMMDRPGGLFIRLRASKIFRKMKIPKGNILEVNPEGVLPGKKLFQGFFM